MTTSIQTRNNSYREIADKLTENQYTVFGAICILGEATNRELADHLGWKINHITGRSSELQDLYMIKGERTKPNPDSSTNHQHTIWEPILDEEERMISMIKAKSDLEALIERHSDDLEGMVSGVEYNYSQDSKDLVINKIKSLTVKLKRVTKLIGE